MAWRFWRVGIYTEATGIKIVGMLAAKRVPWSDIDHFEVRPVGRYPYVGHIIRTGGRPPLFALFALSTSRPATEQKRLRIQGPIDDLNHALTDWRSSSSSTVAA
jgi:hypothetical protein